MLNSTPDSFDEKGALDYLRAKYGTEQKREDRPKKKRTKAGAEPQSPAPSSKKSSRKRSSEGVVHGGGNPDTSQDFLPKKYEIVAVEENRPLVEAIREMGGVHFKHNEPKKGGKCVNILGYLIRHYY